MRAFSFFVCYILMMNHTPQIRRAIQFAARKHHGQMRVAHGGLPYIIHPFTVALLVAEDGAHDDVVAAALLHDTIEDTATTREEIASAFNERVAELVVAVSEVREQDGREIGWRERKDSYLALLARSADDALLIAMADKVDNIESRLDEYEREGETFFTHFSQPNSEYVWFHGEVLKLAEARLPEHPLTKRLAEVHARQVAAFAGK